MASRFESVSLPRWSWLAGVAVLALVVGGVLVVTSGDDDPGDGDDQAVEASEDDGLIGDPDDEAADGSGDQNAEADTEADGAVTEPGGEVDGEPEDAADGEADSGADGTSDDGADAIDDGETEGQPGGGDDGAAGGEADGAADGGDGGEPVDTTISENPLSIALMVADAGALTGAEVSLTAMLEGNGHTVGPFTVTAEPIVNAVNNPGIDLLLFSPSFEFSLLYFPSDPNSLPMLDMARYSWYRRYMLPWGDDVVGSRFSGFGETSTEVFYDNSDVIEWDQPVGPVEVLTAPRFGGEAAMREVMDYSTNGAAQYFLRHVGDTGAEAALGVYVPPGSTITMPAPTAAEEQRFTSVAPWMGLLVFVDDPGDGNQYLELTRVGEGLFEAAMQRLMNP